ncbi:MAG: (E)-4-hydroxy-3-methylbut-2-enyl-diphosphate synthase [Muribaculaceae bacterium]|nr:(E)-4-hydroxy-3-methylbut-2-enyl-diphosphate synthase [Muribaculaceae bacterium]
MSRYNYRRRLSSPVDVGGVIIGGGAPIRVQSMTNTNTLDTDASVAQTLRIAEAGGEIVRLTTQGVAEAANMADICRGVREKDCDVPLVADVHFNPKAAYTAAATCQKVRINPGNFVDAARTFRKLTFTDEEYAEEIGKIRKALVPFLDICKEHHTAVRLGVNHGSLSDRIMSRYGDTPAGMVESVMEFLRICGEENFHDIVISIKASNVVVMVETVRLLVSEMQREGMAYPVHLGVTEAGDGEDGRIKSAVGIGTLLAEGIGDTIRVSLSEPPENEIPVAMALRDHITARAGHAAIIEPEATFPAPARSAARSIRGVGETPYPLVAGHDFSLDREDMVEIDASQPVEMVDADKVLVLTSAHPNTVGEMQSWLERYRSAGGTAPVVLRLSYADSDPDTVKLKAAADFGTMLLNGYGNALEIYAPALTDEEKTSLLLGILQAARLRFSKTEYIACPSCGRTLFDLPATLAEVRKATAHLKGLKIGVMGCIVNGPGEMADADYGYVGAGTGRVSLYKGKELVVKNIPTSEALPALIELLKEEGDWKDPAYVDEIPNKE